MEYFLEESLPNWQGNSGGELGNGSIEQIF